MRDFDLPKTDPISEGLFSALAVLSHKSATDYGSDGVDQLAAELRAGGTLVSEVNNRRYLGNKHGLTNFIRSTVTEECPDVTSIIDIFAGTGAVANAFRDRTLIVNDLLYSNYLSAVCWFSPKDYRPAFIIAFINYLNDLQTSEANYVRDNFANTYFSADDCSKIGVARELIEEAKRRNLLKDREYAILITSVLYGMDRAANTVGHYDAYRKGASFTRSIVFPVLLPSPSQSTKNLILNCDANTIINDIKADLLYCDPPYNSRQYSDAYHLLENIARWEKPVVHGVARKMDRTQIKSDYNTVRAADALRDLISKANVKYIALSYNNMASKGNGRSNAKISDAEIMEILSEKGKVKVFETPHKPFSTGKSDIRDNVERLFICKVEPTHEPSQAKVISPINYIGGKGKLLPQLLPLLPPTDLFVDLFAGGCNVGINARAHRVVFNDANSHVLEVLSYLGGQDPSRTMTEVDSLVKRYGLSDTFRRGYAHYGVDSSSGLSNHNREPYLRLRSDFNEATDEKQRVLLLYVLILFGFNNQIRFNRQGDFNLPVGKRDFNAQMRKKLSAFHERLSSLDYEFRNDDFRTFDVDSTPTNTLFYCDPPYLITQATYNENGAWTPDDDLDLMRYLDRIHASGRRFALSNVVEAKGVVNKALLEWSRNTDYSVYPLEMSYSNSNYRRGARNSATLEVLITNYPAESKW